MTVLANDPNRRTNAQAIADLATLGLLKPDDRIVDLSVGPNAGFWTQWRPLSLTTNDLDMKVNASYHYDVRSISAGWCGGFDVAVWDPPYGYRGTSRLESDANYGLAGEYMSADEIDQLILDGTDAALRLAQRLALVKCQDQNVASKFRDQSGMVTDHVRRKQARVVGKLYVKAERAQPAGKKQLNVWGYHSVLLVIEP